MSFEVLDIPHFYFLVIKVHIFGEMLIVESL